MKRFLVFFMVVGLIVGSFGTAEAKKKKKKIKPKPEPTQVVQVERVERTVQASYFGAQPLYEYRACAPSGAPGCVTLETRANETSLTAQAMDAHGQPVSVWVVDASETRDGLDGSNEVYGVFCGKTDQPIGVPSGTTLELWIGGEWWPRSWGPWWFVPQVGCAPAIATTGTISVTLSGYRTV